MHIDDNHMYHGAALLQIAEHPQFTAINSLNCEGKTLRNAYKINDATGVYFKYSKEPTSKGYTFTFTKPQIKELAQIRKATGKLFIALVCVADRHICCLAGKELGELLVRRKDMKGKAEGQYTLLVTLPKGKKFRVSINHPRKRGIFLGEEVLISRSDFPNKIF